MMRHEFSPDVLSRKAVVYIRQSTGTQAVDNLESQRRQYELVELARSCGFAAVLTIDEDLGRSGSGMEERPGFERLVGLLCAGEVGAVYCLEASRLARNGREWHHLIELCGWFGARVVDTEGVYDPRRHNDRLLLGLKGTLSEFELNLLRDRLGEALLGKAARGELRLPVPAGYIWPLDGTVELDPDCRVQESIRLVFRKFQEFGSARQVLLWMRREQINFPVVNYSRSGGRELEWRLPVLRNIVSALKHPIYAGAYVYGRSETQIEMVEGRMRKSYGRSRPRERWSVILQDHHAGYISWEEFERNQLQLAENNFVKSRTTRRSGRGGQALLSGILRCGRCGRMLQVKFSNVTSYECCAGHNNQGTVRCIRFGALDPDLAVSAQLLEVVQPAAIDAALKAAEQVAEAEQERCKLLGLELQQARYEVKLAARRYEAVDPDNRLVAAELERRWNGSMLRVEELERRLDEQSSTGPNPPSQQQLEELARRLPAVWNAQDTDLALKQRILRVLVEEIIVDLDEAASDVLLTIHWRGGRHTPLRVRKRRSGEHRNRTEPNVLAVIRELAGRVSDKQIAVTLNRRGWRTGKGGEWTASRVRGARSKHGIRAYASAYRDGSCFTMMQAADHLGVAQTVVRRMLSSGMLAATQVMPDAPWQIPASALEDPRVQDYVRRAKQRYARDKKPGSTKIAVNQ